jgi:hypothetical protein
MKDLSIHSYITHLRDRVYMSGIERDHSRIKATGEVFTPTPLVQEILDKLDQSLFAAPTKTFIDPACGDGQFLSEALIKKLENGVDFATALATMYGVDLMQDNVDECRTRLLCGRDELVHIVEQNIVCADGLRYHYRFDGSHPYDDEANQIADNNLFNNLFYTGE